MKHIVKRLVRCLPAVLYYNRTSGTLFIKHGEVFLARKDGSINQRIVKIRKIFGFTQGEFAEPLKISRSFQGGIEKNHRKINDHLVKMICLIYGVNENWLKTGKGDVFDTGKDPRLERIIMNFNKLDPSLQDYVLKYLDWLADCYGAARLVPKTENS
jgi:transcriptional regulator with XRE-family HTH domain